MKSFKLIYVLSIIIIGSIIFPSSSSAAYPFDITSTFAPQMQKNALYMAYYALSDKEMGTYPYGTGFEFASKVKSGGVWDYKSVFGKDNQYLFAYKSTTGEDLGNIHYGYVGRFAGFPEETLLSVAGAYQIYSGTSSFSFYKTYFDDPKDQAAIKRGLDYYKYGLPLSSVPIGYRMITSPSTTITLSDFEKSEIRARAQYISEKIKNGETLNFE